ncbi:MAG TPA: 23S rRNA (uracil(1939)-C(5))-methyltransferase RlmD [Chitinophagales bacterium]
MRYGKRKAPKLIENVTISDMASEGTGIVKLDGKVYFIKGAVPNDVADILVTKNKSKYAEGELATLHKPSEKRVKPSCDYFGTCGGCKWQHIDYAAQLEFKTQIVRDALERIGKIDIQEMKPILGCEESFFYRNKLEFGFTDRRWLTNEEVASGAEFDRRGVGFHVPENFAGVLDIEKCHLQGGFSNELRNAIRTFAKEDNLSFFNLRSQEGFLRNLLVRNTSIGETLVLLAVAENNLEKIELLMQFIEQKFPQITSLQYVINQKRNDTIYDLTPVVWKGKDHVIEMLGGNRFKIGAKSFFQTNSKQAEHLYAVAKEMAELKPSDNVYDLYTGVGSIAMYVSDSCKKVTGIEQVEEAIIDAKENTKLNNIENCTFYAGDVRMILNDEFIVKHGKADVIITDPPRAGMHDDVVKTLLESGCPRIVYVSCNPATQARDLQLLSEKYTITAIQPVDMFPQTTHIENVVRLDLK